MNKQELIAALEALEEWGCHDLAISRSAAISLTRQLDEPAAGWQDISTKQREAIEEAIAVIESDEYGDCHDAALKILRGAL